jgi:hypothetical protein
MDHLTKNIQFLGLQPNIGTSHLAFNTALALSQNNFKVLYLSFGENKLADIFEFELGEYVVDRRFKTVDKSLVEAFNSNVVTLNKHYKKLFKSVEDSVSLPFFSKLRNYPLAVSMLNLHPKTNDIDNLIMTIDSKHIYDFIIVDCPLLLSSSHKVNFCTLQNANELNLIVKYQRDIIVENTSFIFMRYINNVGFNLTEIKRVLRGRLQGTWPSFGVIPELPALIIDTEYNGCPAIISDGESAEKYKSAILKMIEETNIATNVTI